MLEIYELIEMNVKGTAKKLVITKLPSSDRIIAPAPGLSRIPFRITIKLKSTR